MQIQLIRNATLRLTYAARLFIIDPYLAAKHNYPPLVGKSRNPMTDLPCSPEDVLAGVEMVIISHLHPDHFDEQAAALLPKDISIFCQPGDEAQIAKQGFTNVTPIDQLIDWQGITITRTLGQHGTGTWADQMGNVSGFVFQAEDEATIYWAGDTIWYNPVKQAIDDFQPDLIITHSSGAAFEAYSPIIMDAEQTIAVCRAASQATVVATHMETFDHGTVSRSDLRAAAQAAGIRSEQLLIPDDGEEITFDSGDHKKGASDC